MIFDTHTHYDDSAYDSDRDEHIHMLFENGIGRLVNVGAELKGCRESINLALKYPEIYAAVGIHPDGVPEMEEMGEEKGISILKELAQKEKVVAIGEIGLDYHYEEPAPELQQKWFRLQIRLAKELNLPMIIHSREAAKDTLDIMREEGASSVGGVMHCFSYSPEIAEEIIKMGFYVGIGGVITFKNARKLVEVAEKTPLERIVIETDCPYLAPVPLRGERNTSGNLSLVISKIAQVKELTEAQVEAATYENACRLYRMSDMSK